MMNLKNPREQGLEIHDYFANYFMNTEAVYFQAKYMNY